MESTSEKGLDEVVKTTLQEIMREVGEPLQKVEEALAASFKDASHEAQEVALHLVKSGGKRVRPMMTLLAARLFGSDVSAAIPVAVAAEMIHMATLVHDDVIDEAATRRGNPTVNSLWNGHVSVLAGDALLAKALVILVDETEPRIVRIMADMIFRMCEGEIAQHTSMFDLGQTEESYFNRIEKKTALFFAACCEAGALANGASEEEARALRCFGRHIGMAFQVVDDLLDVTASEEVLGKPVGSDLASGVLTLPIIHMLSHPSTDGWVRQTLAKQPLSIESVEQILTLVRTNGTLEYTQGVADTFVNQAKEELAKVPSGPINELLVSVADLVVDRDS